MEQKQIVFEFMVTNLSKTINLEEKEREVLISKMTNAIIEILKKEREKIDGKLSK